MVIIDTKQVSSDVYKITVSGDLLFFARKQYLKILTEENFVPGFELNEEVLEELTDSSLAYLCETKALSYLARAEQSYYGLSLKLLKKGFHKKYIEMALDYLKSSGVLDDLRFCESWLNSRKISHFEGRKKLLSELQVRGISKADANSALDSFFKEISEEDLCTKAYDKLLRKNTLKEKIIPSLVKNGFSYSVIKSVVNMEEKFMEL